ncbi:4-hydroxy-tetrahydrodipicolinate reductase [Fructilactobacillus fructivorans]|uniref:4-hydroxy-tetrahydrodipicolinate reductase n=1 Tax=Fructilactobacillus fructivorans TaxID=1614 RepID=UPI0021B066AE|nr:4-hydroxy-tetrahydrodipicolinate reductase [Fructilactobacillus fructivorans]MCT0151695.1 4-hydroxy-tetrahydrodipicolinate reductase [Fructilactobacillus fructivorans]MCT2867176.1 4-hydroxy-tetrahydrodipicolinate reductase [Fructilactobacillus fructivorans]MCT2868263.1 4-hydroxy-tetrahydrodipicolinate reductase [Fructilactobacillus fructivorans]MCT2872971.1 4-hydroxy-tetrahydrodipicolinate reductase [Fructilactobacillus fructivorans]
MIKVLVAGFRGSMGQKAIKMIEKNDEFQLVGVYDPKAEDLSPKSHNLPDDVHVYNNFDQINGKDIDVWVDFTVPKAAYPNTKFALENGIHPVIGTSGLSDDQLSELQKIAEDQDVSGIIAPNFGISAVLLMKFAKEAAQYFPDAEIIEMHHQDKKDAPSGTAINTAKLISAGRKEQPKPVKTEETLKGARGAEYDGVPIHAVRLPGYVAHEQVLFGGDGEALTIRQDSFDRDSFMNGLKVAIQKVDDVNGLVVGLENIL